MCIETWNTLVVLGQRAGRSGCTETWNTYVLGQRAGRSVCIETWNTCVLGQRAGRSGCILDNCIQNKKIDQTCCTGPLFCTDAISSLSRFRGGIGGLGTIPAL